MIKNALNNLKDYSPLFDGSEKVYQALRNVAENNPHVTPEFDLVVNHYLQSLGRLREYENNEVIKEYQQSADTSRTMGQMDIECSRANRYQQELTLVEVRIELLEDSLRKEEVLEESRKVIKQHVRKPDYVGIFKDKTLLLLLPNTTALLSKNVMTKIENQLNSMALLYGWQVAFAFCMTNYNHWESYDILLKRLEHGLQKGKRDQTAIIQV